MNSSNGMCDWKDDDYSLLLDASNSLWNDDDLSYMLDETTTPVKSCEDLSYTEYIDKGLEPSSRSKRRRVLHFDDEVLDADVLQLCDEDFSSDFLKSKENEDSLDAAFDDMAQWVSGFADDTRVSASGSDQSSCDWLPDCFPNDMNVSRLSDIQMHHADSSNTQTEYGGNNMVPEHHTPICRNIISEDHSILQCIGKKSLMKTPTKMTSTVVLPFAFVKPCGEGAVTLKDINQRIRTPPPSKPKSYPTSAFSGKLIVGKTKIRTEGGKGSITIMRTKD
ncbi:protein XRI1-like [Bidens hawaiensis]|uniref:protein XRI1-like n=1 Tax=Bidens hawaiensis TaxID=980011 RepID=UPI00404ACC6C